jgi:ribosomal protein L6P/L9E
MNFSKVFICLPPNLNITMIKRKLSITLYIYNKTYFYKISETEGTQNIFLDKETNTISFVTLKKNPYTKLYVSLLHNFLFSLNYYFFTKIKFTGKGYRIAFRKKKKIINFYFGHSHNTIVVFRSVLLKKPHKYKFLIFSNSKRKLNFLNEMILNIKPINIFTKRGLRNSRQTIFKRTGKKAGY